MSVNNRKNWEITIDELLEDGWKEFKNPFSDNQISLAKAFEGYEKCYCNAPKNKQVEIYKHGYAYGSEGGFEVEVCGELPDGEWVRLTAYGLCPLNSTKASLEEKVIELLKAWDSMVKNNKDYANHKQNEIY